MASSFQLQLKHAKGPADKQASAKTKEKIEGLMAELKGSLSEMNQQFKAEIAECYEDLSERKSSLSSIAGFDDTIVKGFDLESETGYDDSIDQLDIYSEFLGEQEYVTMKESYLKALHVMTELSQIERDRLDMNAPIQWPQLTELYPHDVLHRFHAIHEQYLKSGKTREKYLQRLEIEFREASLAKNDIELIDSYFEHRRWVKQKQKALVRDLQRDRKALREKTVSMIEQQVEEQRQKLKTELDASCMVERQKGLHQKLEEQKKDYLAKMKVIEEIARAKKQQELAAKLSKDRLERTRALHNKFLSQNFKDQREIDRLRHEQLQLIQEAQRKQELEDQVKANKQKVQSRQQNELDKINDKMLIVEQKKNEAKAQQERLDRAVEGYACRPQVELDANRVRQEIEARELRKNVKLDAADQVKLFRNDGFTADALMKDVRYKISSALHEAGLQQSTYANQVLQGLGAPKEYKVQ